MASSHPQMDSYDEIDLILMDNDSDDENFEEFHLDDDYDEHNDSESDVLIDPLSNWENGDLDGEPVSGLPDFSATPGPTAGLLPSPETTSCLDCFQLFFTDEVIEIMKEQTNLYAQQFLSGVHLKKFSRFQAWRSVTFSEMVVFLAMIIAMGLVKKVNLEVRTVHLYIFSTTNHAYPTRKN